MKQVSPRLERIDCLSNVQLHRRSGLSQQSTSVSLAGTWCGLTSTECARALGHCCWYCWPGRGLQCARWSTPLSGKAPLWLTVSPLGSTHHLQCTSWRRTRTRPRPILRFPVQTPLARPMICSAPAGGLLLPAEHCRAEDDGGAGGGAGTVCCCWPHEPPKLRSFAEHDQRQTHGRLP